MDDFELEVSSLREAEKQSGMAEGETRADRQDGEIRQPAVAAGISLPSSPRLHRWRLIRAAVVGVSLVSVLALVLARSPETPAIIGNMFGIVTPTPTLPLTLGMDKIYPLFSVPWGMLRVDGRVQTFAVQQGQYQPVRLSRGHHVLEYRADLFPTLRCTISAPAASSDTCPLADTSSQFFDPVPPDVRGLAREIDLGAKLERLPADQRAALEVAVNTAMDGDTIFHTDVAPGERYAIANNGIAVATQPLTATLRVTHTSRASGADGKVGSPGGLACADICVDTFPGDGNVGEWRLDVAAIPAWRYRAASGTIVAETPMLPIVSSGSIALALSDLANVQVAVLWEHQQWAAHRIDLGLVSSLCNLGQSFVFSMYADLSMHETAKYDSSSEGAYMPAQPADGCYLTYQRGLAAGKQEPTSSFLFRLGVLLAVNAQAHRLFPRLPVADARDRDIVRQTGGPDQS